MRVRFIHAPGLHVRGNAVGAEVAGEDRVFHPATLMVEGDSLIVRSAAVARPVAVRYAWANAPDVSLCNEAGLPAAPFRSDDW
jgi:sialate O-acetylesterase